MTRFEWSLVKFVLLPGCALISSLNFYDHATHDEWPRALLSAIAVVGWVLLARRIPKQQEQS